MIRTIRKTVSLPKALADQVEEWAREEGKTFSGAVRDALREAHARRLREELRAVRGYWSSKAKAKGILGELDLARLLRI